MLPSIFYCSWFYILFIQLKKNNIKTAFLYGDLKEEIYMECPKGMADVKKDDCIILNKCIYSLVQAACQYYKKAIEILKSSGFVGGNIDPCHYVKKSAKGVV